MRRGFLKNPRPPKPEPLPQEKPTSPPRRTQDGGEEAATAEGAMNMEMTAVGDVSNGGDRVIAVRTTRSTDGEAELPSLDDDNNAKAEPPSKPIDKGKGKEKVVDTDDDAMNASSDDDVHFIGFLPPRPPPRRPGWGRDPREDIFHTVPGSHGGSHRIRAVFRLWPRDPNGKVLMPSEQLRGKLSPDGYPWGATLYDFYYVNRLPTIHCAVSVMTGSALWQVMKELGELDVAASEIEWAKSEGKPRVEGVANTEELIECIERRLQLKAYGNCSIFSFGEDEDDSGDGEDSDDEDHDEDEEAPEDDNEEQDEREVECGDMEVDPASIPPPPTVPVTSPFHPSHYPEPRPTPFENPLSILLQERIPLYLLPQTLYVHDPFGLLPARERGFRDTSWTSRPDIIRTYNLKLSEYTNIRKEVEETRRKAEELEVFKSRTLIIMRYARTKEQIKNHEPIIEVPLPPYPCRMTKVEESHLYLSPVAKVGQGHHSIVYQGEWDLPRDLFTKPKLLCQRCFNEAADKEIQRLKDTGRWAKMLRAAGWGPKGPIGRQPTQADLDEVSDSINLERDGEIIEREITCIVPPNVPPSQIVQMIDDSKIWDILMKQRNADAAQLDFTQDGDEPKSTKDSYIATIRINPPFSHESHKACTHGSPRFTVQRTAKFTVAAKLSIENDHHLVREARNYQQFPEHFFHHYNGYTIVSQLHTIVPVNAVVPQFYGYYMPKKENQGQESYLSPILLLEHCGEPIDPEKLSDEDQDECASMLLRFQRAGWLHESVAPRNFLVQLGKPTEFPLRRQVNPEPSFRLIDFGRSRRFETAHEKQAEELEALRMFEKLNGKMGITFSM